LARDLNTHISYQHGVTCSFRVGVFGGRCGGRFGTLCRSRL
jgi:hypothetical protein